MATAIPPVAIATGHRGAPHACARRSGQFHRALLCFVSDHPDWKRTGREEDGFLFLVQDQEIVQEGEQNTKGVTEPEPRAPGPSVASRTAAIQP